MKYIVLDTETTNNMDNPLVYDCGWTIIDFDGNIAKIIKTRSYVNKDIFLKNDMMSSAYYFNKLPKYFAEIGNGRVLCSFEHIRKQLAKDCKKYNVKNIVAHNARFDYLALQTTQRYLTKSAKRWFFPYGIEMWDSLKMARQTFAKNEKYVSFCKENGYTLQNGKTPRLTAEILYRFISGNNDFIESHTGLEDTLIEKDIFCECLKMNSDIECRLWA